MTENVYSLNYNFPTPPRHSSGQPLRYSLLLWVWFVFDNMSGKGLDSCFSIENISNDQQTHKKMLHINILSKVLFRTFTKAKNLSVQVAKLLWSDYTSVANNEIKKYGIPSIKETNFVSGFGNFLRASFYVYPQTDLKVVCPLLYPCLLSTAFLCSCLCIIPSYGVWVRPVTCF